MLGASLHARSPVFWRPTAGAAAVPSITHLVIEGDSITSTVPSGSNGSFAWQYAAGRPDRTITVRAQASRMVGQPAELNDDGNTLIGNVAEDVAYGPQLIAAMIGANDLNVARTAAQYRADLTAYREALRAASASLKFAWSPPLPFNPTGTPHPAYANFIAQRAALMANARDPAVWGQWADHYLPLGEHPDFADPALAAPLFGDSVHPSTAGQALLLPVFRAALDSLLDPGRAASTRMYDSAWPTGQTGLATATEIDVRFVVAGLSHGGLSLGGGNALAVTGGGAQVRRGGGAWSASVDGWLYNGDVIDLRLTTSAAASTDTAVTVQVGSEARTLVFRTGAAVTPTSVAYGGYASVGDGYAGTEQAFAGCAFDDGVAVVGVDANHDTASTGVSVGGTALSLVRRDYQLELWAGPVAAGEHDIVVGQTAGFKAKLSVQWLTVRDADPAPLAHAGGVPAYESAPHEAGPLTVPAGGVMLGFLRSDANAPAPAVAIHAGDTASVLLGQGQVAYQGSASGLAVARRTATGAIGFDNGFGTFARAALVFKAAGS